MSISLKRRKPTRVALSFETLQARRLLTADALAFGTDYLDTPDAIISHGDAEAADDDIREIDWSEDYKPKPDPELRDPWG